jgi:hypothetical protein
MRKILFHPIRTLRALGRTREIARGGGPAKVRMVRVERPGGWILPVIEAKIEIEARDGTVVDLAPVLPVPFILAWAERLARRLGVPLVRSYEPERASFEVSVPGR